MRACLPLLWLLLSAAVWADVSYSKILLTASEVVQFLPKGPRIDRRLEQFESQRYRSIGRYDYKYKQPLLLYLASSWSVTLDAASAKSEYDKIVLLQSLLPFADTNWSSQVHVGDKSLCIRLKNRRVYSVCFRQERCVGYFTLGLERPMSPKELEALARVWLRRAASN